MDAVRKNSAGTGARVAGPTLLRSTISDAGPPSAEASRPQWRAFLELGFRPLYLLGSLWAMVSIAIWVFAPAHAGGLLVGVAWHAHEMLWGFVATIAVGFLLTAAANWTGANPMQGRALGALCLAWLVARVGFLAPGPLAFAVAAVAEALFFFGAAVALARVIIGRRSRRNYGVPLLVAGLGAADLFFLMAAWQEDPARWLAGTRIGLLVMAMIALLIARRIIPFFAMRAITGLQMPMHTRSGQYQLGAMGLAGAAMVAGWPAGVAAMLAVAGLLAFWQVAAWRPLAVRRVPLLWILYAGYAALGAGLLVAAATAASGSLAASWAVHLVGVGGFSVLIIGMITRTALGHLGRPLRTDPLMVASFVLMIAAAVLRLLALVPQVPAAAALHAAASAWILALGLYLWRFLPWLVRPRAD